MLAGPLLMSIGPGLLSCAILHANNARDIELDKAAEATTLAQLMGAANCRALYSALLLLPYAAVAVGSQLDSNLAAAWGWKPAGYVLLTLPIASDLHRSYAAGHLAELPQQTAQFHGVFCGALAVSFLPVQALARTLLGLLFVMGGGNNFYAWDATLNMVINRLCLALPFEVPRPLAAASLIAASVVQIIAAMIFISGYGGEAWRVAAAQAMLLFLVPVTFVVHDFWCTAKYVKPKAAEESAASVTARPEHSEPPPETPNPSEHLATQKLLKSD